MTCKLGDTLSNGREMLRAAGVEDSAREADRLLAFVLGKDLAYLRLNSHDPLAEDVSNRFLELITRRAARESFSHLTGKRAFWKSEFIVTPDVLDPRPETELLVEFALAHRPRTILDLGTGSGAIAISAALELRDAHVTGVDISAAALDVARANAQRLGATNMTLRQSNWFSNVTGQFDLILSNPPYIPQSDMDTLSPEVRLYEPHQALTPGGDGLDPYRIIFAQAAVYLGQGGRIAVEFGIDQGPDVEQIAAQHGYQDITLHDDLSARPRVLSAQIAN